MPPKRKTDKKSKKAVESETEDLDSDYERMNTETDEEEAEEESHAESENEDSAEEYEQEEATEKAPDNDKCFYKFAVAKPKEDSESDDYDEYFDDDDKIYDNVVEKEKRISLPILTKYERVRMLADRVKHLTVGAKPMLKNTENMTDEEIAKEELAQSVLPYIIERVLPNGIKERWELSELEIVN